jgi:sugar/nucleoside kinase (ribokinase family)
LGSGMPRNGIAPADPPGPEMIDAQSACALGRIPGARGLGVTHLRCTPVALTVVGSIAFDSVRTPFGERNRMLGGSAVHFALAARFFTEVNVVGPVGDDFEDEHLELLRDRGIDVSDVERVPGGKTFQWHGHYEVDMNLAHTDDTQLGVFADFEPKLSDASRAADVLFLGNIQPDLQRRVRAQSNGSRLAALDSMNLWIETTRDSLVAAIGEVDCLLFNDSEIRMLTEEPNLARAARAVMEMGPRIVVAKRGEYGAVLFTEDGFFALPGFLLEDVRDPTGAGDSFAGGFLGYLDMQGTDQPDTEALRRAMAYGTVLASFNVEEFGTERAARLTEDEISERYEALRGMTHFEASG